MPEPRDLLASIFGFPGFRPGQEDIVDAVLAGRKVRATHSLAVACFCDWQQ